MPNPIKAPYCRRILSTFVMVCFFFTGLNIPLSQAQELNLPKPGVMVHLSPPMNPPMLKGIKVHSDNPFRFDFILDVGDESPVSNQGGETPPLLLREESTRLIKYFLASLTVPEKDLWVNLSPYEKDRIVPESFGQTEMGRDLLAQDYLLKQITASLIYPEDEVGKKFWKRIYEEAAKTYGTTNIPVNTFNKVWIVPEKAVVYENAKAGTAYVVESRLKVMLECDYLSWEKHAQNTVGAPFTGAQNIVREIIIPELTREVNEGANFAQLRQVYNSLILAAWYKKKIKDSILSQVYADKNKVQGVNIDDPQDKQKIYEQYLKAFKKGVYNYIKEELDPITQEMTPRKYFSGGAKFTDLAMASALKISPISIAAVRGLPTEGLATIAIRVASSSNPEIEIFPALSKEFDLKLDMAMKAGAVYATGGGESYDEVVTKELAKKNGVSVNDLEADFERTVTMLEKRIQHTGFIEPQEDSIAAKMHEIFESLIKVYQKKTSDAPGRFHVVDDNTVNAFVIRKRTDVYFYKGLYETLYDISKRMNVPLTEDMIAFIIAHELSHSLQHTSHQGLDVRDFHEAESSYLIQMMKNAEYDADMNALELMDKSGYSVLGAIDAMNFLEFIAASSQAEAVLSSHPYISLRKHRLSQIIFDQKTNVFTHVKAPRTSMGEHGRMKSQDVDFRYLMDKSEEELVAMIQKAETVTAVDQLTGILTMRKRMNVLKSLSQDKKLKTSFLQHVYLQAVKSALLNIVNTHASGHLNILGDNIDYSNMKEAAAIYDFGTSENRLGVSEKTFENKLEEILKKFRKDISHYSYMDNVVTAEEILQRLHSTIMSQANKLTHHDFDGFLLPPEQVKDLIQIFKVSPLKEFTNKTEEKAAVDPNLITDAINDPIKLISAFFYANYLGQEASLEFSVPTTQVRVRLQRRKNHVYLENPAHRDIQATEGRKKLQDIVLLHYAMGKSHTTVSNDYLDNSFPGIKKLLTSTSSQAIYEKYYSLLSEQYPKPIAAHLAMKKVKHYLYSSEEDKSYRDSPKEFLDEITRLVRDIRAQYRGNVTNLNEHIQSRVGDFIDHHPLVVFIKEAILQYGHKLPKERIENFEQELNTLRKSSSLDWFNSFMNHSIRPISDILDIIADVSPKKLPRRTQASHVFLNETRLDYYIKKDKIISFEELVDLPDWMVADYINQEKYDVNRLIKEVLEDGTSIDEIFTFMRTRLSYRDRFAVFTSLFFGYESQETYLLDFFKTILHNNPANIIKWFMNMFSKEDALKLISRICEEILYKKAKDVQVDEEEATRLKDLTINLLEYLYSQTSRTFSPDGVFVEIYLDLINERIERRRQVDNDNYVHEAVYNTLMILSASVNLKLKLSCSKETSTDGSPDFKSPQTSLSPKGTEFPQNRYQSRVALHNFAWNDWEPSSQSIFIAYLPDLSIEQLKGLLKQRLQYLKAKTNVEYRGEAFSLSGIDEFFSNLITLIILKKIHNPNWETLKKGIDRLDDLLDISVAWRDGKISEMLLLKINQEEINQIPYDQIKKHFIGIAIPSVRLDKMWKSYVDSNNLYNKFPEIVPLLLHPNVGNDVIYNPIAFLKSHKNKAKVPYRNIVKKFFMDASVYSYLFNKYVELHGKGYVYGTYRSLEERLQWMQIVLPHKSIIKDGIVDLWEIDIFPEIIADLPSSIKMAQEAAADGEDIRSMWTLLGEMDDDVGRLQRLNGHFNVSPERIYQLLDFYRAIIPLTLSPQKISRYGATAYLLWKLLPENAEANLSEHLDALTQFMPEPNVLRDELLMKIAKQYAKQVEDISRITEKLYSNNLLSRNKDLRTEDFVSETLLHLFGGAKIEDRRDILLWIVGAQEKPHCVSDIEDQYNIDFTTLPDDVKLLPATIREKFMEGFMLGDNGVLDPQNDNERHIMADFLERVFLYTFPEGANGISKEGRTLISRIFLIVMKSFPPYRRVQVIKALAALRVRPDFENTSIGERLAVLLGVMGPVGIKVAQYLSENETLVPDNQVRSSLGALRNKAPEITKISAFSVLQNEVPLCNVVVREMGNTVGAASIKQVNRGQWLNIELLAELVIRKAGANAGEVREKLRAYKGKEISFGPFVSYMVAKANDYGVSLRAATVPVVYKLRGPNIDTSLGVEFVALDDVAHQLTSHNGKSININDLVETVKDWVLLEMYFSNEVRFSNMISELDYGWAEGLSREAGVTIAHPKILYATDSLIVEEEIQGVPILSLTPRQQAITMDDVIEAGYVGFEAERVFVELSELDPREAHITLSLKKAGFAEKELTKLTKQMLGYDYEKLRELLRHMLLHQIFVDGVFHADLHQGNILITPDGRLVMIDRGNVGTLNKEQIEGAKILLKGLSLREKELIKEGIERIFLNAQHAEGAQPTGSSITMGEIEEILSKEHDLKMTMNMISVRAVQGAKHSPGGKDFSTFLKAFTQAMYLFPTDITNGRNTLQAIAQYVSMDKDDVNRATEVQAKYVIVQDIDVNRGVVEGKQRDMMAIVKRIFYQHTERSFLHSLWQPMIFRMMAFPVKRVISKASGMKGNMITLARTYGRQIIEDNIDEFVQRPDSEIGDVIKDVISVPYAEKLATNYMEHRMKKGWGKWAAPIVMPLFKGSLFLARPFTRIYVEAAKEWMDTEGKRYISGIIPQITVKQGVNLLSQVFVNDFSVIKSRFDEANGQRVSSPRPSKKEATSANEDQAMLESKPNLSVEQNPGGIDFNSDKMNLQIQNSGGEIKFHIDPAMLEQLRNAPGFTPVIINIQPLQSLQVFLGINQEANSVVS